jgi:hypothetical protein
MEKVRYRQPELLYRMAVTILSSQMDRCRQRVRQTGRQANRMVVVVFKYGYICIPQQAKTMIDVMTCNFKMTKS